ncbi:hypothetical protein ACVWZD_001364 [Streptomyces sp. TE3672]
MGAANRSSSLSSNRWVSRSTSVPNSRCTGSGSALRAAAASQVSWSRRWDRRRGEAAQVACRWSGRVSARSSNSSKGGRSPSTFSRSVRIAACPSRTVAPPRENSSTPVYSSSWTWVRATAPCAPVRRRSSASTPVSYQFRARLRASSSSASRWWRHSAVLCTVAPATAGEPESTALRSGRTPSGPHRSGSAPCVASRRTTSTAYVSIARHSTGVPCSSRASGSAPAESRDSTPWASPARTAEITSDAGGGAGGVTATTPAPSPAPATAPESMLASILLSPAPLRL